MCREEEEECVLVRECDESTKKIELKIVSINKNKTMDLPRLTAVMVRRSTTRK